MVGKESGKGLMLSPRAAGVFQKAAVHYGPQ